jgi:hypothetical protein
VEQVVGISDDVCMGTEEIIETLRKKFERVSEVLDERGRRVWAAAEGVRPQFKAAATEGTPKRFIFCQNCVHL